MSILYPSEIDTTINLPDVIDLVTPVGAEAVNRLRDAIIAIETELGADPSGINSTIRQRLDAIEGGLQDVAGSAARLGRDLGGTITAPHVIGLRGRNISPNAPNTNEVLAWDGDEWIPTSNLILSALAVGPVIATHFIGPLLTLEGKAVFDAVDSGNVAGSNQGIIYYDLSENKFKVSENGTAYTDLVWRIGGDLSGTSQSQTVSKINGATVPAAGALTAGHVLKVNGVSTLGYGYVTNSNVDAAAAIAGSKINPDFGSQDITGNSVIMQTGGPSITRGAGAPAATPPDGSIYLRTDGTSASAVYSRQGGVWSVIGGNVSSGSADEIQVGDGAGGFTAATNVKAGANYIAVGPDPSTINQGIDLSVDHFIWSRNDGDSDNVRIIGLNTDDEIIISESGYSIVFETLTGVITHRAADHVFKNNSTNVMQIIGNNLQFGSGALDVGSGDGVIGIDDCGTAPTSNPTNGVIVYSQDGAFKVRQSDGLIAGIALDPTINGLRLTLTTGVPITTSDVSSSSTIYYTPYTSGYISLWDGTAWILRNTGEISMALSSLTSGANYDIFAYWTGSAVALELSSSWTNATTRSTALGRQSGILIKDGDATRRYVGTFRTTGTSTTTDTKLQRYLWNYYNRVTRTLEVHDSTDSWTYSSATYRQARNTSTNGWEFVIGDTQEVIAMVNGLATATTSGWGCSVGIGIDSTTTNSATTFGSFTNAVNSDIQALWTPCQAHYKDYPVVGYHKFNWLEISGGITVTWYGDVRFPVFNRFGLFGSLEG